MTDPTRDDPYPSVLRMSAPLMVSFVMRSAFTFVDTIYAAMVGDAAVAAIGLTFTFEFVMVAFWIGLSTGLTSVLSRSMGAHEGKKIEQYLRATWRLVWIISPLFLLALMRIAPTRCVRAVTAPSTRSGLRWRTSMPWVAGGTTKETTGPSTCRGACPE